MSPQIPPEMLGKAADPAAIALQLHAIGLWSTARLVAEQQHLVLSAQVWEGVTQTTDQMVPRWGSAATWYRLHLHQAEESPIPGWCTLRVGLEIDSYNLGIKPLTLYLGDVDDFHTGMARFPSHFPMSRYDRQGYTGEQHEPGDVTPVWVLTARRTK